MSSYPHFEEEKLKMMSLPKILQYILFILIVLLLFVTTPSQSLPLSTSSRWIVDAASGHRVKLKCVNWAGHVQAMLVEGLDKRPLHDIVGHVVSLGFNCVRLTWATYMYTHPGYANLTIERSLDSLSLSDAKNGVAKNNPSFLNLTTVEAQEAVVDELGKHGVMVVLDNHVSKPQWCCDNDDGNGFFGDTFFDPNEWLQGLNLVANHYKGKTQVVAMSMRNELRGSRQNEGDWYKFVEKGARKIHKANPNVLVIVSGLDYDTNLSFLKNKSLDFNLDNKLVYEAHWYSFTNGDGDKWLSQPLNQFCEKIMGSFDDQFGFLLEKPVPLFMSELGVDQGGMNRRDNRFLTCLMAYAVDRDLDWAMWALQGSYYLRNNQTGPEETYGVLDFDWAHPRNPKFLERYRLMQKMVREPNSNVSTYHIMYHPESGHCIRRMGKDMLAATDCQSWSRWSHGGDGEPIRLKGTSLCLKAGGVGRPAIISTDCSSQLSKWKFISSSKQQLAAQDLQGRHLCLQAKSSNSSILFTKRCICFGDENNCLTNPQSQWFKLISSNMK